MPTALRMCFPMAQGVYAGGMPHANALVKAKQVTLNRFKLLAGYMGWDAGQLQREVCFYTNILIPVCLMAILHMQMHMHEGSLPGLHCVFILMLADMWNG